MTHCHRVNVNLSDSQLGKLNQQQEMLLHMLKLLQE